jgi:hypothetical protein
MVGGGTGTCDGCAVGLRQRNAGGRAGVRATPRSGRDRRPGTRRHRAVERGSVIRRHQRDRRQPLDAGAGHASEVPLPDAASDALSGAEADQREKLAVAARPEPASTGFGVAFALLAAVTLDGVPENLALGVALVCSEGELTGVIALLVAIFLSNLPESLVGAVRQSGRHAATVLHADGTRSRQDRQCSNSRSASCGTDPIISTCGPGSSARRRRRSARAVPSTVTSFDRR